LRQSFFFLTFVFDFRPDFTVRSSIQISIHHLMRIPFASNRYFQLVLSLGALAAIIRLLMVPQENEKMNWFVIVVALVLVIRTAFIFFRR